MLYVIIPPLSTHTVCQIRVHKAESLQPLQLAQYSPFILGCVGEDVAQGQRCEVREMAQSEDGAGARAIKDECCQAAHGVQQRLRSKAGVTTPQGI